jgi:TonB-linked SusC/RagA family outer membrane protein
MNAQITVSGKVTDNNGPVPGAYVILKGTSNGTSTDFDGNYTIKNVPSDGVLVFSYLGYKTKEIKINNSTQINVTIEVDLATLDEIVVIGYGTQRKEAVTGSVVSIKGEELAEVQAVNFQQALQGRAAGVQISTVNSRPGSNNTQIRIRGIRSLTGGNDPLIVLNGIPFAGGINDVNMNDIESLDILKDASATAIYGSRGANGVVLITTKTGKKNRKATFTYNTYYGAKEVFGRVPMMNSEQLIALREATSLFNGGNPLYELEGDEELGINTDWQDLIYGPGLQTSHDINISGGGENGSFSIGMGYFKETSVLPVEDFQRFSLRAQVDQQIGAFRFGVNSIMNYNITNAAGIGLYGSLSATPMLNPYNADGTLKRAVNMPLDQFWVTTRSTVEGLGDRRVNRQLDYGSYNNIYGEVAIPWVEGLKYRMNLGLNLRVNRDGSFNGIGAMNPSNPLAPNNGSVSSGWTSDYVIENLLTYDRTFAEKHKVGFVGLFSAQNGVWEGHNLSARNIPNEQFLYHNLDTALLEDVTGYGSYRGESGLISYMARAQYEYDNRYLFTATLRTDGSSRLAPGYKWFTYPAVSAGWNIANESFMENVDVINQLKLRVGYGTTANQAIGVYSTLGSLGQNDYNFGPTGYATGYSVNTLPNPDLSWENTETYNIGLEFGLLNNRISGTIEYYTANTSDVLYSLQFPATAGVGSFTTNIGSTSNKGVEIALNATILDNPDGFTWDVGLNAYTNRNEITSLADGTDRNEGNYWFVGSPINVIYDYKAIGLWNESDPDYQYLQTLEPGGNAGMIKVEYTGDFNPDGSPTRQINTDDRQIIDPTPDFQGGFNTRLAYKNFDFNMVGTFQSGGIAIATLYSDSGYLNLLTGRRNNVQVDYWTPTNTGAQYPAPGGAQSGDGPKYGSTMGYFDGSFLKVRAMTLGYNFDQDVISNLGLKNMRLFATIQNPFILFSDYHNQSGMDIETNSGVNNDGSVQNTATGGRSYSGGIPTIGANVPSTRNFMLGFNLTF